MTEFQVVFARLARKELEKLETGVANRVMKKIKGLRENPYPKGCRKIQGEEKAWRIRVGDYRIIYEVRNEVIDVASIRHRRDAYR